MRFFRFAGHTKKERRAPAAEVVPAFRIPGKIRSRRPENRFARGKKGSGNMTVTFKGVPMTLCGKTLREGGSLPDFTLTGNGLEMVRGSELTGIRVLLTVPSLDTGVCDLEVRRFNETAAQFEGVSVYAVSMDLPFAQKRWCGAAGVDRVRCLSDYRDHSFGKATGTRIEELGLLTRAVFVADEEGKLVYVEYVPEVAEHPDYEACLNCLKKLPGSCRAAE